MLTSDKFALSRMVRRAKATLMGKVEGTAVIRQQGQERHRADITRSHPLMVLPNILSHIFFCREENVERKVLVE